MALFEPRPRKLAGCHLTLIGPRSKPTDQALRAKFTRILTAIDKRPHGHSVNAGVKMHRCAGVKMHQA